ncbi:MAG TPA: L17 family ribosomal protein, partial [Anaerolineales bacterium]|nr:L17 family ribosomal protein [Anaerolineales bacterium]
MRHRVSGYRLGRSSGHRTAMRRTLVTEFFRHERIKTTRAKAAAIRDEAERLITRAKAGTAAGESRAVSARRLA